MWGGGLQELEALKSYSSGLLREWGEMGYWDYYGGPEEAIIGIHSSIP